jgi:hypothetical protein
MQASMAKIKTAREIIWLDEPADIARLRTRKGARNQGASAVIYAAMKLGQLVTFLNHLREVARKGGADLGTMKAIADPLLDFYAGTYGGFYQMTDTAAVVRLAKAALQDVKSLEEYVALTGELSLYIGRMDYWVDLLIPWAKFGEVYEQLRS